MSCRKIASALKKKGYLVEYVTYSGGEWGGGYILNLTEESEAKAISSGQEFLYRGQFNDLEDAMDWVEQLPSLVY